jgi:predicted TIM-barrel fold metal-dependent hydrolase
MIIDFHTHIFSPRIKESRDDLIRRDPLFAELYTDPKAKLASAEDLIAVMDRQGITASVVLNINWSSADLCRESNDYISEAVSRYPGRLYGLGMIDFNSPDQAFKELDRCCQKGMKGIGEVRFSASQLGQPQSIQPILDYIIANKLILLIHASEPVGHSYPGKGDSTPDLLYPFINQFPELKLVCAHWGGGLPFYALMPKVKKALDQVYFDSAASPYLYSSQVYTEVTSLVGDQHILFGSDYPLLTPERLLKDINSLNLPESTLDRFLYSNAAGLLGINNG